MQIPLSRTNLTPDAADKDALGSMCTNYDGCLLYVIAIGSNKKYSATWSDSADMSGGILLSRRI